jgi:cobalt-zinc-cadmium resistance protein CzcA
MIKRVVDFALNNRFIVLIAAVLLFGWGAISFHNLPVEAYPDVANNYVNIITQWPGRSAEEVEQQVTVPLEIAMAGIPHMTHLRSTTLAGLSSVTMIFDDDSEDDWNRQKVGERLTQVTLPAGLQPQIGTDWSPVGQIYWYTLKSTNPEIDTMQLKSIEDWQLEKAFRSVPGVVDVSSFGGLTREYQVTVDPEKLIAYGLTLQQVQQQLAANNVDAGGSFIEQGQQQINVQEVGLFTNVHDIEQTVLKAQNGTALRVSDIATVAQGPKIRLGQIGKTCKPSSSTCNYYEPGSRPILRADNKLVDNNDVVEGVVLLQKGDNSDVTLEAIHKKVDELNGVPATKGHPAIAGTLPPGVKVVPFLDRSDLLHLTTATVLENLTHGIILVVIILFLFLGNVRGALIVAITIPFALLFASICLDLRHIPANLLSLGALDFGRRRCGGHG